MRLLLTTLLLAALAAQAARARDAGPIPRGEFDALRKLVKPDPGEDRWAAVAWHTSLWEARQEAARLGKPILLWEMDGHPLGCT